jgi:hypothetical protein
VYSRKIPKINNIIPLLKVIKMNQIYTGSNRKIEASCVRFYRSIRDMYTVQKCRLTCKMSLK